MPSKRKPATAELNFPKELLDELVKGPMTQGEVEAVCRSNGVSGKTVITDGGPIRIEVPRDREGSFEPLLSSTSAVSRVLIRRSWRYTPAA